ncbi:glycosyl transferase family protein [Actinoplanes sp. SE50]|uniref:glycosyltransferase n=1 Tax=unclassified Actinoplanes TaxID=2626549 RepID=UPI00023EC35A|nr:MULTISPECIES: glycosyltransferase [unclassified Actinoplanes]AEV87532.1 glycosyl transferase family protein [Actinoplanes sp. SE50/110]ATO85935.1 glycosyl transferase family protein [Actinoplanes sp. SE50]SLM03349.1 glycosyl transferase family protein [Actinoplanes sp. SE50/110]
MSVVIRAGTVALPVLLAGMPPVDEIVVVVGRRDGTGTVVPPGARVVRQTRAGAGNALACGVAAATGDIVVTLAADGSCDPAELPRYVQALCDGSDVAQGARQRPTLGARIVLWMMAALFGARRTDPGFGYRAFWRDAAGMLELPRVSGVDAVRGDGAEIDALLTVRAGLNGLSVTEVPSAAAARPVPLVEAVGALLGEWHTRRRVAPPAPAESIVVLTGKADPEQTRVLPRIGTDAVLPRTSRPAAYAGVDRRQGPRRLRALEKEQATRPRLRVINGEGGGTGPRTGTLRSVPPAI